MRTSALSPSVAALPVVSGITFPATLPIADCRAFVRQCFAHESNSFAGINSAASADAFRLLLVGIAVATASQNDASKVKSMESYAVTLPGYKVDAHGVPKGSIGKVLTCVRNAASIGRSLFVPALQGVVDERLVDLAFMLSLPSWSGLQDTAFPAPKAKSTPLIVDKVIEADADTVKALAEAKAEALAKSEAERLAMYNSQAPVNADADAEATLAQAEAEALAKAKAEAEALAIASAERMAVLTAQGRTMAEKAHALCVLCNELGVTLNKTQLAILAKVDGAAKKAA